MRILKILHLKVSKINQGNHFSTQVVILRNLGLGFGRNLVEILPLDLPEPSKPLGTLGNRRKSEKSRTKHVRKPGNHEQQKQLSPCNPLRIIVAGLQWAP